MSTVWEPDPYFIDGMNHDPYNNDGLLEFAKVALSAAIAKSPGRTRRWLMLDQDENGKPKLVSVSSIWHIIEFGSVNNHPYAPMRKGVEAAGAQWADDHGQ